MRKRRESERRVLYNMSQNKVCSFSFVSQLNFSKIFLHIAIKVMNIPAYSRLITLRTHSYGISSHKHRRTFTAFLVPSAVLVPRLTMPSSTVVPSKPKSYTLSCSMTEHTHLRYWNILLMNALSTWESKGINIGKASLMADTNVS